MKKNLLLYILLGFLVIMNGFFLFKHFSTPNQKEPKGHGRANFIAKQLEFDADQLQKFEQLDAAHREKINVLLHDIRESKSVLFDKVSDKTTNDSVVDSITTVIANMEKTKEVQTFRFFKSIEELCNENQKLRFKSIIKDALGRQGPQRDGPPGGRPDDGHRPPPLGH